MSLVRSYSRSGDTPPPPSLAVVGYSCSRRARERRAQSFALSGKVWGLKMKFYFNSFRSRGVRGAKDEKKQVNFFSNSSNPDFNILASFSLLLPLTLLDAFRCTKRAIAFFSYRVLDWANRRLLSIVLFSSRLLKGLTAKKIK